MGISSTLWFLVRVIPKPQRAGYPCMRAAAPVMSGFVLYLLSLGGMTLFFRKAVSKFNQAKYLTAAFSLFVSLLLLAVFNWNSAQNAYSKTFGFTRGVLPDAPNSPMGTGIGVLPGRVVWSWNPDATNENCKNTITDAFFMAKNNNNAVINEMMDYSIKKLAGKDNVKDAWDAIFKNFNERKTGTASGYSEGQTIFIKVNNGQAGWAINMSNLAETGTTSQMTGLKNAAMAGTTPSTVLAIVRELVDDCQIPQENILIGEPMTHVYKSMYDMIHNAYPNVKILDKDGYTSLGRTKSKGWTDNVIYYSDNGDLMPDAYSDNLMQEMYDADYMINAAALKAHARNGVSLNAKLHFGSHGNHPGGYGYGSFYLHAGLICTVDNDVMTSGLRGEYGMYRVLVDLMGHENIGGNTVLFLVDGLWGGVEATDMPVKWGMEPFKTDFPSSIFISQDGVAIESVCLDFLRAEADKNRLFNDRPFFPAVDDHLHQAADKTNWPKDLVYDPEGDGTEISSLGVHEHWNNPTDKQYSRNLGTGQGIELIQILKGQVTGIKDLAQNDINLNLFPNPCIGNTTLSYTLKTNSRVSVALISADGKHIQLIKDEDKNSGINALPINTSQLVKGLYVCRLETNSGVNKNMRTIKLIVQ
ncbi:MAG TPA: DUF362 domain-containing protein [Draconibacterium sp.]|nr:DUF362 domain-containing protein [Draconibacterium sp.]